MSAAPAPHSMLVHEAYIFDPRPKYPLLITAKRYWTPDCTAAEDDPAALTLVFAHGTGHHKEHWEPTIARLCALVRAHPHAPRIREVWAIDCPNHGDAAVLNEHALRWGYTYFDWQEYARALHAFLTGLGNGVGVDFSARRLVGIGHSMGAISILACMYEPALSFASLILVDPMLVPPPPHWDSARPDFAGGARTRRDIWPSRAAALAALSARPAFQLWDPRVLALYVEQGLRELPTAEYPDTAATGVTLKCTRAQEVACYVQETGRVNAYRFIPHLCATLPVHLVYGAIDDHVPRNIKDRVLRDIGKGREASVRRVAGAGHLVPQMQPDGLATAIFEVLEESTSKEAVRSRL